MEPEIQRLIAKHKAELQSERDKAQDHTRYPPHFCTLIRLSCMDITNFSPSILLCCAVFFMRLITECGQAHEKHAAVFALHEQNLVSMQQISQLPAATDSLI